MKLKPIQRVLLSVTDKSGLTALAHQLSKILPGIELIASGGTAAALKKANINYTLLSDYTQHPECFNGRLKTLHPKIAGGILFRRGVDDQEAQKVNIPPIDVVICNLYDFAAACQNSDLSLFQLIESMDIGGSMLIRSACKNYPFVTLLVDPNDYPLFLQEVRENEGQTHLKTREKLAVKGLTMSASYESLLTKVFAQKLLNERTEWIELHQGKKLKYGENPDQQAWIYSFADQGSSTPIQQLTENELSYNNYTDTTAAYNAVQKLLDLNAAYATAIIKHGSLCGYATGRSLSEAFTLAWEGDSISAFGSVIALISPATEKLIPLIEDKFIEVLIAPSFTPAFTSWAAAHKKRLRLLQIPNKHAHSFSYACIHGGMLIQTQKKDFISSILNQLASNVVTRKKPKESQKGLFAFGVAAVNYAKSNAVAIVREKKPRVYQLLGMGAGQPNRVDSLKRLALPKAIENLEREHSSDLNYDPKRDLETCIIASDGFFPFDDSIRHAAEAGIQFCIQPGGSKKDDAVIACADEKDMCMVLTGERYFSH
ncbi:MAG: bifunctional phosphoribosylaminoimidazolecarboxamide formyltransferase/IMP cyclohydrolase [Chlamydiota bacterium]